jgi:hypothetical protein
LRKVGYSLDRLEPEILRIFLDALAELLTCFADEETILVGLFYVVMR